MLLEKEEVEDVTYKGALALTKDYTPTLSCEEELLANKEVLGVSHLVRIVNECKKFLESSKESDESLSNDEKMALATYTHDLRMSAKVEENFYSIFNSKLRKRDTEELKHWKGYLYYLFAALDKLKDLQMTVYRGVRVEADVVQKNYKRGRKVHWSAFSSSTSDVSTARKFSKDSKIIFKLLIQTGKDIQPYSMFAAEKEILLTPNMSFTVAEELHQEQDGYSYVVLIQNVEAATYIV